MVRETTCQVKKLLKFLNASINIKTINFILLSKGSKKAFPGNPSNLTSLKVSVTIRINVMLTIFFREVLFRFYRAVCFNKIQFLLSFYPAKRMMMPPAVI